MSAEQSTPDDASTEVAINADACVHAIIADAGCQACVEACPFGAWRLDDEGLGFDGELCESCGVCASACPNHAISVDTGEPLVDATNPRVAYAACRNAIEDETPGQLGCIGILGLVELMQLYAQGVRTITLPDAALASCHCGAPSRFTEAVLRLNCALHARAAPGLVIKPLQNDEWTAQAAAAAAARQPINAGRRNFLTSLLGGAAQQNGAHLSRGAAIAVPGRGSEDLYAHVPQIDPQRCTACDACIRTCPSGSLTLIKDKDGTESYRVDARKCTGCAMCVDICADAAITIRELSACTADRIDLNTPQCRACGASFHHLAANPDNLRICPICVRANHNRNLFQTLE